MHGGQSYFLASLPILPRRFYTRSRPFVRIWTHRRLPSLVFAKNTTVLQCKVIQLLAASCVFCNKRFTLTLSCLLAHLLTHYTRSYLTCQYSFPFPVWGNAGDKWGLKGQRTCCCYCDQVDLPILLSVSSAVVLVISEALKGLVIQSSHACQPQGCVSPHYAKRCMCDFLYSFMLP